jgi:hypothetical protein
MVTQALMSRNGARQLQKMRELPKIDALPHFCGATWSFTATNSKQWRVDSLPLEKILKIACTSHIATFLLFISFFKHAVTDADDSWHSVENKPIVPRTKPPTTHHVSRWRREFLEEHARRVGDEPLHDSFNTFYIRCTMRLLTNSWCFEIVVSLI